ncbi:MAG: copper chaperone PCu(A)C [Gammaproteobacteria bacterium]|nr:copper chaperone PCu(A)C [Gammaproteobacteria bacterium]
MAIKFVATAIALLASTASFTVSAELQISNTWIREAPPSAKVLAGYMELKNTGNKTVTVTADVSSDFQRLEIHDMSMDKGMMTMKKIDKLEIAPGQTVQLAPGSKHLMLINPVKKLRDGDEAIIAIKLDSGERKELSAKVKKVDGEGAAPAAHQSHQHHSH